jgi:hypothetical protein
MERTQLHHLGFLGVLLALLAVLTISGPLEVLAANPLQEAMLEAKAKKGDPDDAFELARYYDREKGKQADKLAMQWYIKAGEAYLKKGKLTKAERSLKYMKKIDAKHASVAKLQDEIDSKRVRPPGTPPPEVAGLVPDKAKPSLPAAAGAAHDPAPPAAPAAPTPAPAPAPAKAPDAKPAAVPGKPLDAGLAAWAKRDYAAAKPILVAHAEGGNPAAQFALGSLLFSDLKNERNFVNQWDPGNAMAWYRKAAQGGHNGAAYMLGFMFSGTIDLTAADKESTKKATETDPAKWMPEVQRSAEQGHSDAMLALAQAYRKGHGVTKSSEQALRWARAAAETGDPWGQMELASAFLGAAGPDTYGFWDVIVPILFQKPKWTARDPQQALVYLRQAANQDMAFAQIILTMLLSKGWLLPEDLAEAKQWWGRAAAAGLIDQDGANRTVAECQKADYDSEKADPGVAFAAAEAFSKGVSPNKPQVHGTKPVQVDPAKAAACYKFAAVLYVKRDRPDLSCEVRATMKGIKAPDAAIKEVDDTFKAEGEKPCT